MESQKEKLSKQDWFEAIRYEDTNTIRNMLANGFDVNAFNFQGTALHMSVENKGRYELTELLLDAGADMEIIPEGTTWSPFMKACCMGNKKIIELFLKRKVAINHLNNRKESPFLYACLGTRGPEEDGIAVLDMLYEAGADVHAENNEGENAFLFACSFRSRESDVRIMEWLLKKGIDPKKRNVHRDNSFMLACSRAAASGRLFVVKYLYDLNADVRNKNDREEDALLFTMRSDANNFIDFRMNPAIVRFLFDVGFDANKDDEDGKTALYKYLDSVDARYLHPEIIKLFIENIGYDKTNSYLDSNPSIPDLFEREPEKKQLWNICETSVRLEMNIKLKTNHTIKNVDCFDR